MASYYRYIDHLQDKIASYRYRYRDNYRNIALRLAYWNFKFFLMSCKLKHAQFKDNHQHILVRVVGGMGDYFISAKYVSALQKYLGQNAVFDIMGYKDDVSVLKTIFGGMPYVQQVISGKIKNQYDLDIYIDRFPKVVSYVKDRLDEPALGYIQSLRTFELNHQLQLENIFLGRCYSMIKGRMRENQADVDNILQMSQHKFVIEVESSLSMLEKFGLKEQRFITFQTGGGRYLKNITTDVRQWPIEYYTRLIALIKRKYPAYQIVQLGATAQPKMEGIDVDLRGKTTNDELFAVLRHAKLHIAQESGMIIARHFLQGGMSVGLFGPTDEIFFGFPENINLTARRCLQSCEWLARGWIKQCLKTGNKAECMQLLTSETVMKEIEAKGCV